MAEVEQLSHQDALQLIDDVLNLELAAHSSTGLASQPEESKLYKELEAAFQSGAVAKNPQAYVDTARRLEAFVSK